MKPLEKLKLIDDIGRELQKRMSFSEIDSYFGNYGIPTDHQPSYNSKYVYSKEVLAKVDEDIIVQIANELAISHEFQSKLSIKNDSSPSFWKIGHFRLFLSHLASFKSTIGLLKSDLEKYGISGFVAHEDIEPTKQWQDEIEKGLFSMDALCAILMPGFKESNWTDQEIGVAIGRDILVIPIRRDLDPYGFIGKYQGFQSLGKNINQVAEAIFQCLVKNQKTRNKIINCLVDLFLLSNDQSEANERLESIKLIDDLPIEKILFLHSRIKENKNLKNTSTLNSFNELMKKYNFSEIGQKDFDKTEIIELNDLPF